MRTLDAPPPRVTRDDGSPAVGSYRGPLPPVDLSPLGGGRLFRVLHEKRWIWAAIATEQLFVAAAVVRLGYASNAFVVAYDPARRGARGELLFHRASLLPGPVAEVDNERAPLARFRSPLLGVSFEPKGDDWLFDVRAAGLGGAGARVQAVLRGPGPTPISAIASVGGGSRAPEPRGRLANTTEKRVLLDVEGTATLGGVRHSLRGGLAGFDFTAGYLGRETKWRWSFGMGRAVSGERVAWNVVEGFVGEAECGLWVDGELVPLPEAKIVDGSGGPMAPWTVRAGDALDLTLTPGGMHADDRNLGVVRSRFVQPCGAYSGVIRHRGRELVLARVFGVAEIQDVLW